MWNLLWIYEGLGCVGFKRDWLCEEISSLKIYFILNKCEQCLFLSDIALESVCSYLTCDKFWETPVKTVSLNVYTMYILMCQLMYKYSIGLLMNSASIYTMSQKTSFIFYRYHRSKCWSTHYHFTHLFFFNIIIILMLQYFPSSCCNDPSKISNASFKIV